MSNSRLSFRAAAFRSAVFALISTAFFMLASVGTSAASLSFIDSVGAFFGPASANLISDNGRLADPGPTPPNLSTETGGGREFRGVQAGGDRDTFVSYAVEMISQGEVTVTAFTLQFDPTRLSISNVSGTNNNPDVTAGSGANLGTGRIVNTSQLVSGKIGVLLNFQSANPAGTREIVVFRFRILPGAPDGLTPLTFVDDPISLSSTNADAEDLPAKYTPSNINVTGGAPTPTPSPTPTPVPGGSISGTVFYGTTPVGQPTKFVPDVLLTAVGSVPATDLTDAAGAYLLSGLGPGPYTVTPSKPAQTGNTGVSLQDASTAAMIAFNQITPTTNQRIAADASGNGTVSLQDASEIAKRSFNIPSTNMVGQWKFVPASRMYPSVSSNLTGENYDAILVGDVTGNWTPPGGAAGPADEVDYISSINSGTLSINYDGSIYDEREGPQASEANEVFFDVGGIPALPRNASGKTVLVPVTIGDLTGQGITSYEMTISFDPAILQPATSESFDTGGTITEAAGGYTVLVDPTQPAGRLRIGAFGTTPLSGSGTLILLRFNVLAGARAPSPLNFVNFVLGEGTSAMTTNGSFKRRVPTPGNQQAARIRPSH